MGSMGAARSRRTFLVAAAAFLAGLVLLSAFNYFSSGGSLEIVDAEYGVPGRTCKAGAEVKRHASDACGGFRPRCLVSVSTGWCGDPAPGAIKTLTVDYTCGATRKRASAVDGTGLVLSCP